MKLTKLYVLSLCFIVAILVIPIQVIYGTDYYSYGRIIGIAGITGIMMLYNNRKLFQWNKGEGIDGRIALLFILGVVSTGMHFDRISLWGVAYAPEGILILALNLTILYVFRKMGNPVDALSTSVLDCMLVLGSGVSIYAIGEFFMWWPKVTELFAMSDVYHGNMTTIGNRNFLGSYMTIMMALAIASVLFYKRKRGYIYVSIITCGLFISQTRSAYIAFAILLLLSFYYVLRERDGRIAFGILFLYLGIFIVGGIYLLTNIFQDPRIVSRLTLLWRDIWNPTSDSAGSDRMLIWRNALQLAPKHFLLGYGPDHFGYAYETVIGPFKYMYQKAHNEWLQMLITLGAPYLIVYISLFITAIYKAIFRQKDRAYKLIALVLIGYTAQSMFNISVAGINTLFYMFWGMALYDEPSRINHEGKSSK